MLILRIFENQLKAKLTLKPGMKVLSVGCGIGGGECRLHQMFGVHVHGLDLSQNTRDCIIHIRDKDALFQRFYKWLKPGGQLLISGS